MVSRWMKCVVAAAVVATVRVGYAETVQISTLQLGSIEAAATPKADKSVGGNALKLGGQTFAQGIGLQAPGKIILKLDGGSDRFTATVGVDDEVQGKDGGTVAFTVTADGVQVFPPLPQGRGGPGGRGGRPPAVAPMKAGDAAAKIDLNVKGVRVLVLDAASTNDGVTNDHADWAEAQLDVTGAKPEMVPPSKDEAIILTPPPAPTPRINSTQVFGVRPGHPVLFTVATTGDRPMTITADGLPDGLKLDGATGQITGKLDAKGEHAVTLHAKNAKGTADGKLKIVVGDEINLTPQLGWNSWNCFGSSVTADKVKAAADAMVKSGLINHGWTYVNIDDFWEKNTRSGQRDPMFAGPARDDKGEIIPNGHFPDMKGLTDYIHEKGLKAGLYSSPGPTTCGGCTASYQHEAQDAQTWAKWGFDYIKYDLCSYTQTAEARAKNPNGSPANAAIPYKILGDALKTVDRDILFSLCQYGEQDVGSWAPEIGGNSWRTTGDIQGNWRSVTNLMDQQLGREKYAGPGHWNDPDMLVVGRTAIGSGNNPTQGLSSNEMTTHMTAWIILDAPMLIGCDMTKMDAFTLSLLSNDEVLAANQDALGKQAVRIIPPTAAFGQQQPPAGMFQVYSKDMEDGSKVVAIFSRNEIDDTFGVKWSDLKISGKQTVRDLWRQKDLGVMDEKFEPVVPRHGVILVRITPVK